VVKSISIGIEIGDGTSGGDRTLERFRFVPWIGKSRDDISDNCDEAFRIPRSSHRQDDDEHNSHRSSFPLPEVVYDVCDSGTLASVVSIVEAFKQTQSFPTTQVSQFTPPLGAGDANCCPGLLSD